jgi:hypothetical protein
LANHHRMMLEHLTILAHVNSIYVNKLIFGLVYALGWRVIGCEVDAKSVADSCRRSSPNRENSPKKTFTSHKPVSVEKR